ncbi:MAG TPA: ABC transporter substrate-binding protein, partial [Dongiaceae bacterium]|nr:ABC transporter substrate-binding protein [Dongiaceae bacterium]
MLSRRTLLLSTAMTLVAASLPCTLRAQTASKTFHALSLLGEPKYGPDFPHLDYVNPQAPKGGEVRLAVVGSFDNFNPFIVKGTPAPTGSFETLMTSPEDDPNAEYGLIAESIEVADDRSWVAFTLRPEAR